MTAAAPRLLLISDFTIAGLAPYLASGDEPRIEASTAPFDQVVPVLLDAGAGCWSPRPDAAFVWTRPQSIRAFARAAGNDPVAIDDLLSDVDAFADAVIGAAGRAGSIFVASWTMPAYERGLGMLNFDPKVGLAYLIGRMNLRLAERFSGHRTIHLLDAARWQALAGSAGVNPKLWHLGKIAFGPEVLQHAAADLKAGLAATRGRTRKLVVVDLDETLWGGVVGDVGWQQLRLGGHDAFGEAYVAFQRALKRLTRRGIVLAIVSKNTEAIALEAIDQHPEMVLRRDDFVGWRINWQDKAANIAELAAEINLGLDSVVFIDDNPAERARVRGALPDVLVPEWPADKLLYEQALASLTCFDTLTVSDEDR
ncbi:MAG TPA: HAD-IIIC family phosphatase, partial [Vicinamibacterales bacterium]|nr:HAD-IIIC family phosphatase [Vicinamibacterales bacterium]